MSATVKVSLLNDNMSTIDLMVVKGGKREVTLQCGVTDLSQNREKNKFGGKSTETQKEKRRVILNRSGSLVVLIGEEGVWGKIFLVS